MCYQSNLKTENKNKSNQSNKIPSFDMHVSVKYILSELNPHEWITISKRVPLLKG